MGAREILEKTKVWIEAEQIKAERLGAEPFSLTSFNFCLSKATGLSPGDDRLEEVLTILRATAKEERMGSYSVVSPIGALFVIKRALIAH